jgi:uncharacterized protein (DUF1501 family)
MNLLLKTKLDRSQPNRRDFMVQSTAASLGVTSIVNTLAQLKLVGSAAAQGGPSDYKALVCFFLNGGNDANNLLIPMGGTARPLYDSGRGVLAIPGTQISTIPTTGSNAYFGASGTGQLNAIFDVTPQDGSQVPAAVASSAEGYTAISTRL